MDKGLTLFQDVPMVQRIISRLSNLADEMIVTSNNLDAYQFTGLQIFPDLIPGRGALGGLYTALKNASQPLVGVIGCDMPFVNPGLLEYQYQVSIQQNVDVVIPFILDHYEPLHAIYRRETCLPAVEKALNSNQWKMVSWLPLVNVHTISQDVCAKYDPKKLAFINFNTPAELVNVEKLTGSNK